MLPLVSSIDHAFQGAEDHTKVRLEPLSDANNNIKCTFVESESTKYVLLSRLTPC